MTSPSPAAEPLRPLRLNELNPYLSITILECPEDDPAAAFRSLCDFLKRSAQEKGHSDAVRVTGETAAGEEQAALTDLGFDEVYGISREVIRPPGWAAKESAVADVLNQLTLTLRRNRLVAVHTGITSNEKLTRWVRTGGAGFRFLPSEILVGTFHGDGRMLWVRGVHRPRTTKADSMTLAGLRLQDAGDDLEDSTYALSAAKVRYLPDDETSLLREMLTVSPVKSRLSWKQTSHFPMFLGATYEVLDRLEKSLVAEEAPETPFPRYSVVETDLSRVRGAFDLRVPDPDQVRGEPGADEDLVERAELLRSAVIEVRGEAGSARAFVDVGFEEAIAGTLVADPSEEGDGFGLKVRYSGAPPAEGPARQIREAIGEGDLLTIYYLSGHTFSGGRIYRHRLSATPFPHYRFEDFTGYDITEEKPATAQGETIHQAIGRRGDRSLFAWVVDRFSSGWLLCDDGAGEVADFLHFEGDTLTAIHVKAADHPTSARRIAVTPFEVVVSQAEKNIRALHQEVLLDHLSRPRAAGHAAWHDGERVDVADFTDRLRSRPATGPTEVVVVQPHLLQARYDRARADAAAGATTGDTFKLALLDTLLHSTRRTVTALWNDLTVIGCA
ncbi:hypothetical protein [Amycolatopsis sp. PS_44_ISF1]|uniref:hypothetical protein n=1 Tax=Amycolatopsis sp. PS_44_ISF1 TaxID=2974917 RepID=UPI0028DE2BB7|nr:hypothetical protein [Amycolatopsis sp. PS_44_ISF1]MDT8913397.1 hypothetical protein [Amycolatopsis sp. PS_44_ISF1]